MVHRFGTICVNNRLIVSAIRRFNRSPFRDCIGSTCLISRQFVGVNLHPCSRFSSSPRSTEDDDDGDFFGIKYFTADDIKGVEGMDETKRKKLNQTIQEVKQLEEMKVSPEGFQRTTSFGKVRYDRENKVDYTGQFEEVNEQIVKEKRRRYMMGLSLAKDEKPQSDSNQQKDGPNLIEEQYFNELRDSVAAKTDDKSSSPQDDLSYIDYQYFKEAYSPEMSSDGMPVGPIKFHYSPKWDEYNESLSAFDNERIGDFRRSPEHLIKDLDKLTFSGDSPLRTVEEVAHELMLLKESQSSTEEEPQTVDETEQTEEESTRDNEMDEDERQFEEIPKTALEYVTKIRQGQLQPEDKAYLAHLEAKYKKLGSEFKMRAPESKQESFDSTGKRNFMEQSPRLYQLRRDELVHYLANRVLFNERDLVAIDKPNGLIVEGGSANSKYPALEAILPDLSKALFPSEGEELYIVHRLDRDATGVLLLARSLSMVSTLRDLFAARKISKYYWAIVRGVPDPPVGIIDIPIEAETRDGIERMCLRPECDNDFHRTMGSTQGAFPATTHYRILRKHGNACMIELKPEQGIKHQIRVHLGLGLRTPILGDHKYSHLDRIAPQKLPDDMLRKLNVRQAKVRNIPLHLHAKLYIIPGIGIGGGNISIPAHLPGFFRKNMTSLGLYKHESLIKNPIAF